MSRVLDAVAQHARRTPDAPALTDGRLTLSWAELDREINWAVAWLAQVLEELADAPPVGVALDNAPAWVIVDLALVKLGRAALPLPPFFTPDQQRHALADAGAGLLISADAAKPALATVAGTRVAAQPLGLEPRPLHPGTAKITYTSGSTGTPKGVCLSQAQLERVATSLVEALGVEFAGRHLAVLPLGVLLENVAGLYPTPLAGGCYDARPLGEVGFGAEGRPDLLRLVEAAESAAATSLILVPELLRGLMATLFLSGRTLPALKMVAVGGAKVAPQLIAGARAMGLPAYEGYGLSECGSVAALNTPHADRPGSVGRLLPHISATLAPDGEIVVREGAFLGYVGGPPHEGPYHTGDLGEIDADGWVRITGRKSNVLITAFGRNVAPEWVESELLAEPEIAQAAVFGEAAPSLCAVLVPSRAGLPPDVIDEVVARVNARLPDYARVGRWRGSAPFDPARGEVTANGRPRRHVLHAAHRDFIDQQA